MKPALPVASSVPVSLATLAVELIPTHLIDRSSLNPRSVFSEDKIIALAESLKARGQLEAVLVRPNPKSPGRYELANGERRWRAAQLAGLPHLAAKVREMNDAEMVEVALAIGAGDNVESLSALEEAAGYAQLMKLRAWDYRSMAAYLGRSHTHVMRRLSLLQLPKKARAAMEAGALPAQTAYYIASIPGEKVRAEAAEGILHSQLHGGVMPEAAALTYIREHICRTLRSTPFDPKDGELTAAGPCTTCRFRAGNNPEEYGDVFDAKKGGGVDRCMHPTCYEQKVEAHRAKLVAKYAVDGKVGLSAEDNARVFPREESGIHYASEFVDYQAKPTPDLLKKEVAMASAPTWKELLSEAEITVYVGVDQAGKVVELVRRDEAVALANSEEREIFSDSQTKRSSAAKAAKSSAAEGAPKAELLEGKKRAQKAQHKAHKESRGLLAEVFHLLRAEDEKARPFWRGVTAQSLVYDLLVASLTPEEVAYVVEACDPEATPEEYNLDGLNDLSSRLTVDHLGALNVVLLLAPRWRAEGVDGKLAQLWAKDFLSEVGQAVQAARANEGAE